ncbi:MAG: hypothetical protein WCD70_02555 [Alphaproteobacteria bacterium]
MDQQKYDELLAYCLSYSQKPEDDIQLWIIIDKVSEALGLNSRKMTVVQAEELWAGMTKLITMMLQNGFIAFDFVRRFERQPWAEQDPKQVMAKIRNKWVEYKGEFPNVGFIVWFQNTKAQGKHV